MKMPRRMMLATVSCLVAVAGMAVAETKLEVKGVHLCCGQCVKIVGNILGKVDGVTPSCNLVKGKPAEGKVTIVAPDDATARKALDALAAGGFHGTTGNKKLEIKDDSGAKKGKVSRLTVSGAHNCCGMCRKIIKQTLAKVDGVTGDNVSKAKSFVVEGNFDPVALVKALNKSGVHVKVKK